MVGSASSAPRWTRDRVTRVLIQALAAYSLIVVGFFEFANLGFPSSPRVHAIALMALFFLLLWVVAGGWISLRYRDPIRRWVQGLPGRWEIKFFLFATALVLLEEAITTSMTNLAPEFGSRIGVAYITASTNYLLVIAFSSVVVIVPAFAGWAVLLRYYRFTPKEVFLLFGLLGTTAEGSLNLSAYVSGYWFFVYGLMVYLPAYAVPSDRPARPTHWTAYVLAYLVPLAFQIPVVVADTWLRHRLGIVLFQGS